MTADVVGGVWSYACELIRALAPYGVEVTLATMGDRPSVAQVALIESMPNATLIQSSFANEWMPRPWYDVDAAGAWLLDLTSSGRYDVVHLNSYVHAALPFGVPTVVVAHSCVCTWFRAVHETDAPPAWDEYRRRVRAGLDAATAIVSPTYAIGSAVLAAYGCDRDTRVIPNGRDATQWWPAAKEPFVLTAGRLWDEAKGIADLEACADTVRWPIHVAGSVSGPEGQGPLDVHGVHMLGELRPEVLADWMGRASIYALPARYEPFGLSVLEAALCDAVLVLGDVPSLREVWRDAAVYVPPRRHDLLAQAINALADDPFRRRALAAAARSRALQLTP